MKVYLLWLFIQSNHTKYLSNIFLKEENALFYVKQLGTKNYEIEEKYVLK